KNLIRPSSSIVPIAIKILTPHLRSRVIEATTLRRLDDQRGKELAPDTPRVEAECVSGLLVPGLGVVAVDDGAALAVGEALLVRVPGVAPLVALVAVAGDGDLAVEVDAGGVDVGCGLVVMGGG